MFYSTIAILSLGLIANAAPAPNPIVCQVIEPGPPVTAITPGTAVAGLVLGESTPAEGANTAVLGTSGFHTAISYSGGGIGFFSGCHELWLNIIDAAALSWKPLYFGDNQEVTTSWSVDSNDIITAEATATHAATSEFLACPNTDGTWTLFLQTGNQTPSPACVLTQLQVGKSTNPL